MQAVSQADTTHLTPATMTKPSTSSCQLQIVPAHSQKQPPALPPATYTPIARHTRSHHQLPRLIPSATTPVFIQSQARALPPTHYSNIVPSPALTQAVSPAIRVSHSHILLSQCHSPLATTGVVCKQRCNYHQPMSQRARYPAIRCL